MMDGLAIARIFHVLGVVIWIGGMAFVTIVVLPAAAQLQNAVNRADMLERIERRFAWIARAATLVVGISGFYMVAKFHIWDQFFQRSFWWMHAMVVLWVLFTTLLFIAEPFWLRVRFTIRMRQDPDRALRTIQRAHWILLLVSLATIAATAPPGSTVHLSFPPEFLIGLPFDS